MATVETETPGERRREEDLATVDARGEAIEDADHGAEHVVPPLGPPLSDA